MLAGIYVHEYKSKARGQQAVKQAETDGQATSAVVEAMGVALWGKDSKLCAGQARYGLQARVRSSALRVRSEQNLEQPLVLLAYDDIRPPGNGIGPGEGA